jgi:hypothetical protein
MNAARALLLLCLAAAPATQPAPIDPELARLIALLGDSDFKAREAASKKILARGKSAIPALQHALTLGDPEIQLRAELLIKRLSVRELPGGPFPKYKNGRITAHSLRVNPDPDGQGTHIELSDEGRQIRILKRPDKITLTVSAVEAGKAVSETYTARNPDELKEINPHAHAVFAKWGGGPGPGWQIDGGFQIPGNPIVLPLQALANLIENAMDDADTPAPKRQEIFDLLAEIRASAEQQRQFETDQQKDKRLQEFFTLSDNLRAKLTELDLPDPGEALPPPQHGRLGIQLATDGNALIVDKVVTGSRAQRIGLQSGDVITRIAGARRDGKPANVEVRSLQQLRQALLDFRPPITVETIRAGQTIKLEEKPAAPAAK